MKRRLSAILAIAVLTLCLAGCSRTDIPGNTGNAEPSQSAQTDGTAPTIDTAASRELRAQAYTNVPGAPTQNAVLAYTLSYFPDTPEKTEYPVAVLEPDSLIVDSLEDIYRFVQEEKKMPVRYFPEEVQKQVEEILDGSSVDILHISEFFGIRPELDLVEAETARGRVQLEADYVPGQLVVVLFGSATQEDSILWTPLAAQVEKQGEVSFDVPSELLEQINEKETLFLVLTIRRGASGDGDAESQGQPVTAFIPSKNAGDLTGEYGEATSSDGTALPEDFRIFIQEHNEQTKKEIGRLQQFLTQEKQPIAAYFSDALQAQMALLLENVQPDTLVCYNANFLGAENYVDTYGDVIAGFRFAVPYPDGTQVVCLLGTLKDALPESQNTDRILPEESAYDWTVLRGKTQEGYVFLTFSQQCIPVMEQEGALALILSQPILEQEGSQG